MGLQLTFNYLSPFLNTGFVFACLRAVEKSIASLKLDKVIKYI